MIVALLLLALMVGAVFGWAVSGLLHQQEMAELLRRHEAEMARRVGVCLDEARTGGDRHVEAIGR